MADDDIVMALKSSSSLLEQLGKALVELESHKSSAADTVSFTEISVHFHNLEEKMTTKYNELEAKEKSFKQELSDGLSLLAAKEAEVAAKEQDMYDRIQLLKDAAVAAIVQARANHPPPSARDILDVTDNKVNCSLDETNASLTDASKGESSVKTAGEVTFHQELTRFCEQMDTKGLLTFVMKNRENITVLCEELSNALKSSIDPARLILDSLDGFYPPDKKYNKEDIAALLGMRESCVNLMKALNALLARADTGPGLLLSYEIKQQAKAIANEWWPKLTHGGINNAASGKSLEAEAYLQLLATFRIVSEVEEDELCKLMLAVCERRQAPELCQSLGLAHKMPGVIEEMISKGKLITAVHFAHAFELVEQFPTVPLLKNYLKDMRRKSQRKNGNSTSKDFAQDEVNARELRALRAVIDCVQKYDLEADYPLDTLHTRAGQLERANPDNRKTREPTTTKPPQNQKKRYREPTTTKPAHNQKKQHLYAGGVYGHRSPAPARPAYMDRGPYAASYSDTYSHVNPYSYPPPPRPTHSQHVYEQNPYYYPPNDTTPPPPAYGGYTSGLPSSYHPSNDTAPPPPAYGGYTSGLTTSYHPPNDTAPPPPAYGGYTSSVPSSYQPYM
ncbi:FRIGIDA-like protein 3 [Tanacetum coccineum]|uniref:FRIGIDA-like protein n=1 Tax=Tanacetum coccineum TaxID=301880 RepID=A0ABQ5E4Q2_9ASTR